jgi:hypothetical protein
MTIGARQAIAPQSSVIEFVYPSGAVSRNGIEFARCREFTGQTSIVFDGQDAAPTGAAGSPARGASSKTFVLPSGLTIDLRLRTPIDPAAAHMGDEIAAIVEDEVSDGHRTWLPAGSVVHGRIRRIEQRSKGYALVGIEFSEAEVGRDTAEFVAELRSIGVSSAIELNHVDREESQEEVQGRNATSRFILFRYRESFDREIPGVGYLYITSAPFRIPAGFRMVWRTEPLRESDWR